MPRRNHKKKRKYHNKLRPHPGAVDDTRKLFIAWSRCWQIKQRRWGPWRKVFIYDGTLEENWRDFDSWLVAHNDKYDERYDDMEEKKRVEGVILGEAELPWKVEER